MDRNKIRDLLRKARTFIECSPLKRVEGNFGCIDRDKICAEIDAALAAPPRNCDRFSSESEMRAAFIDWYNEVYDLKRSKYAIDTGNLKHDVDGILHDYIKWLLAPAMERKGGAK